MAPTASGPKAAGGFNNDYAACGPPESPAISSPVTPNIINGTEPATTSTLPPVESSQKNQEGQTDSDLLKKVSPRFYTINKDATDEVRAKLNATQQENERLYRQMKLLEHAVLRNEAAARGANRNKS